MEALLLTGAGGGNRRRGGLQSGGTNATAKQLLVSVGQSAEEEERARRKEGRTKRGIARCCETSVRRHERYCKAVVSKSRAVQGGGRESAKEGREDEARHRKML